MITVDGIDCRIYEPRRIPSTQWYSHKSNGPGLTYELGIAIHHQNLVWIRGPERSARGDLNNFKAPGGLKSKIPAGKKVIADEIYKDPVCAIKNPQDTKEVRRFKRRARARHENFNGRLKNHFKPSDHRETQPEYQVFPYSSRRCKERDGVP